MGLLLLYAWVQRLEFAIWTHTSMRYNDNNENTMLRNYTSSIIFCIFQSLRPVNIQTQSKRRIDQIERLDKLIGAKK